MPGVSLSSRFLGFLLCYCNLIFGLALPQCHPSDLHAALPVPQSRFSSFWPWGEALNPGPGGLDSSLDPDTVLFSFSNPSGLRTKESLLVDLGPGIHGVSETQLSCVTQPTCSASLPSLARQQDRLVRVRCGAPAPLRARSQWAGSWTGVLTFGDFPSQEINLPYGNERACGRLLSTRHLIGTLSVLHVVVYGFPAGPTWPNAHLLTTDLLNIITNEVVLGSQGPRIIGGDFNMNAHGSPHFDHWRRLGWCSAQDLAALLWGQEWTPTCKGQTERDLIWLSPEAASLCQAVLFADVFSEHATIMTRLLVPSITQLTRVWPLPSPIPWGDVDSDWYDLAVPPLDFSCSADQQWAHWAQGWERSLNTFVDSQPSRSLHASQTGRLQRHSPLWRPSQAHLVRPSREGEVSLRNDLTGGAVKKWFKQLRRLQSYVASAYQNKPHCSAVTYRLELWSSILQSPGFDGGFRRYWFAHRGVTLAETPPHLPSAPPGYPVALAIFHTFKACFEQFEHWHLRQRGALLKAKYDRNHAAIFHDLQPPKKPLLDLLELTHEYDIIASDPASQQIQLHQPLDIRGHSRWFIDDVPVQLLIDDGQPDLCVITPFSGVESGSLIQNQTLSTPDSIQAELLNYWKQTWCSFAEVDASVWVRIVGFFQAFVPRLSFSVPPLTLSMWKRGLRRFKKTAARGVDGISAADLLALPDSWTSQLLTLLHRIESGVSTWPAAILYGVVNLLAKDDDARTIPRFRPVVVFSVIYRAWASIRAKQMLHQLHRFMDCDAYGFVPGCEPSQLWLLLQSEIEISLQQNTALAGLSVDLVRAFNFTPRQHSFVLAEHLGVPAMVLTPWKAFLQGCTRAFRIHECLSEATTSTCGMPEGDALSVYAMVQLNFVWHIYQKQFCPSVRSLSFVDNLSLVASCPAELAVGYSTLCSFFDLWNLRIDLDKSYCWSLHGTDRLALRRFPMKAVLSAHELGGCLSFCKRINHGLQLIRCNKLAQRWLRLERSPAPLRLKLRALVTVFWPAALHGANGTLVGEQLISTLRSRAMRHLRLNRSGTNPLLRLSLCPFPSADPGFWLLRSTVLSFRRLLQKEPILFQHWSAFHRNFDGTLYAGPCTQFMVQLNLIGWSVDPPWICDHDGCSFDFLTLSDSSLGTLLFEGWLQYIASQITSRRTMKDVKGLDPYLTGRLQTSLDAKQTSWLAALQSGAFMASSNHAKFDNTKCPLCSICGTADSQAHWLTCPRFSHIRADISGWPYGMEFADGVAFACHLLPSRTSLSVQFKHLLLGVSGELDQFESLPSDLTVLQHVFSDGTRYTARDTNLGFAGWAVVNASTASIIARGHLSGLTQSSDRAELAGAVASLSWQQKTGCNMCLWMDNKFVVDSMEALRATMDIPLHWEHADLWHLARESLASLGDLELYIRWGPSHLDETLLECPFEDWYKTWNDWVDEVAGQHNLNRGTGFWDTFNELAELTRTRWEKLKKFRSFFFQIAAAKPAVEEAPVLSTEVNNRDIFDDDNDRVSFCMVYTISTQDHIMDGGFQCKNQPPEFAVSICRWLHSFDCPDAPVYRLSFLELTIAMAVIVKERFPFPVARKGAMDTLALLDSCFTKPTFAYLYRCVRDVMRCLVRFFGWDDVVFSQYTKVSLGICMPCDGVFVRLPLAIVQLVRRHTFDFFSSRPYRRVCDLARPLPA